jgi:hypothetical protein
MREEPGRQHAVREIPATSRDGADIRARPEEVIGLGDDDPRREIIKAEMSFQEGRYLDRIGGVFGCRMGDRHDDDDLAPVDDLARGDDCTRPGLATLIGNARWSRDTNTRSQAQALVSVGSRRPVFEEMVKNRIGLGDGRAGDGLQCIVVKVFDAPRHPALHDHIELAADMSTVCGRSCLVMTTGDCKAASW